VYSEKLSPEEERSCFREKLKDLAMNGIRNSILKPGVL